MTDFATTYRELVMPRLSALCIAHGSSIAHGLETFTAAFGQVMGSAIALGASCLPAELFADLEDYLLTSLSTAAFDAETKLDLLRWKQ
jgi:hypothetical protein